MRWMAILVLGLGLAPFCLACGSGPPRAVPDAEDQFLLAKKRFDDRKYTDAQIEFQKLIWSYPGSEYVDEAQFYLAESYFQLEDFSSAIIEYQRLLTNYSQSPFSHIAQFKVGLCYYEQSLPARLDQDDTHNAIRELGILLEEYPNSEYVPEAQKLLLAARTKLAYKEYLNGQLYYKMGDYLSAIIYFQEILKEYSDTKWSDDAQFSIGECYRRQEKWRQALDSYRQVLDMNPSEKLARRVQMRMEEMERKLGGAQPPSG